jgi:hypothetical protein
VLRAGVFAPVAELEREQPEEHHDIRAEQQRDRARPGGPPVRPKNLEPTGITEVPRRISMRRKLTVGADEVE